VLVLLDTEDQKLKNQIRQRLIRAARQTQFSHAGIGEIADRETREILEILEENA
jgi:hypothetical protein